MNHAQPLTQSILQILQQLNKPLSVEELSFRTRSTDTLVLHSVNQLLEANVVVKEGELLSLNQREQDYQLKRMLY
jgi:predicted transcriptional regulator